VVATRVGFAPDLVRDGENGNLVDRAAASVGDRLDELDRADRTALRVAARATAEQYSWPEIARRYLALVESLRAEREVRA
jgi:UDP-glucose:(heptosyl)LPS alpha-1,3-glucosyltransferase